jgi:hypothetical protein
MVDRVEQFENESIRLGCPDFADAVIGRETAEAERLGTLSLVPGMPTEICLATEKQTALAYMAKPVMDQVERALREEQVSVTLVLGRAAGTARLRFPCAVSEPLGNVQFRWQDRAFVIRVEHALWQDHLFMRDRLVGQQAEQVRDAVQPCAFLVIAFDDVPGRFGDTGAVEHLFLGFGILFPPDP